jgi:hypothetical protein
MATAALPPMPGQNSQPATMGGMYGGGSPEEKPQADVQEQARSVMRQIRDYMMGVDTLARQFPASSKAFRKASEGLREAMVAIVSDLNRTQESPSAPNVVG